MELVTDRGVILYDETDRPTIDSYAWKVDESTGYVLARRNGRRIRLHREIMRAPEGILVDHKNGNKLDNRRENLRLCNHQQNRRNSRPHRDRHYKGVFWCPQTARFRVIIDGCHEGYYSSSTAAANAYNYAASKRHGEFARLNRVDKILTPEECSSFKKQKQSSFKGVSVRSSNQFVTHITVNSVSIYVGSFPSEEEAARAYDRYVVTHGLDRKLNFS